MRSRIFLGTIFGAVGGFLGYVLQERLIRHDAILQMPLGDMLRLGAFVGAMLGIAIGAVEGVVVSSPHRMLQGMILGGLIGVVGGVVGVYFGSIVYNIALFGKNPLGTDRGSVLDFTHMVLARSLGWTFLGAFPGLAAGAATLSPKRALHGLAGGLIGGFIGGFLFDIIGTLNLFPMSPAAAATGTQVVEVGGPSRAIGFTAIGCLTGLFIGLVEELFKQAWVRVLAGNNEGKDYIISKPLTVLGRDERADVPLYGDSGLAPQHAAIKMEQGRHLLLDGGAQLGAVVNGNRVQQSQLLRDGDMIQLGQVRLLFREKATARRIANNSPIDAPKTAASGLVMPSHLCPYCGTPKDAAGSCQCNVPGVVGAGTPTPASYAPPGAPSGMPLTGYGDPSGYGAAPAAYGGGYGTMNGAGGVGTQLLAVEGPYMGQAFPLYAPSQTIGRDPARDIALTADTTISRGHAHVAQENGQHVLYDDGSSNGTFVNNVRISVQTLAPGDIIQMGATKFRYE